MSGPPSLLLCRLRAGPLLPLSPQLYDPSILDNPLLNSSFVKPQQGLLSSITTLMVGPLGVQRAREPCPHTPAPFCRPGSCWVVVLVGLGEGLAGCRDGERGERWGSWGAQDVTCARTGRALPTLGAADPKHPARLAHVLSAAGHTGGPV